MASLNLFSPLSPLAHLSSGLPRCRLRVLGVTLGSVLWCGVVVLLVGCSLFQSSAPAGSQASSQSAPPSKEEKLAFDGAATNSANPAMSAAVDAPSSGNRLPNSSLQGSLPGSPPGSPPAGSPPELLLELFLSRAELKKTEFENYKLNGENLFKECGEVKRGRFVPLAQDMVTLSPTQLAALSTSMEQLSALFAEQNGGHALNLPEPGSSKNLFDGGQTLLTLRIGQKERVIRTDVDGVAEPTSVAQRRVASLVKLVRGVAGNALCGNVTFYGIERTIP